MSNLDNLERLEKAASPLPWELIGPIAVCIVAECGDDKPKTCCDSCDDGQYTIADAWHANLNTERANANFAFMTELRNAAPNLFARIRELEAGLAFYAKKDDYFIHMDDPYVGFTVGEVLDDKGAKARQLLGLPEQ